MQQMGSGVIPSCSVAETSIHYCVHPIAEREWLAQNRFMGKDSLHWLGASAHIGNHRIVVIGVEPAHITSLSAGVGIKARVIEYHFHRVSGIGRMHSLAILNDSEHFAIG